MRQAEQGASIPLVQRLVQEITTWKPTLFFHEGDISYARCGSPRSAPKTFPKTACFSELDSR